MAELACRVGCGAGFAGDRVDPAVRMAASGEVDAIALECLAERTLLPALKARAADPRAGYDPRLRRRLRQPALPRGHRCHCGLRVQRERAVGQGRRNDTGAVLRRGLKYSLWIGAISTIITVLGGPAFLFLLQRRWRS